MYFGKEVVATDVAIVKALELRVHVPASEDVLLLAISPPELLFLVRSVAT
jgi:hypothetical protein